MEALKGYTPSHRGVDFGGPMVRAVSDGFVSFTGRIPPFDNVCSNGVCVVIESNGMAVLYSNLVPNVGIRDRITTGKIIGRVNRGENFHVEVFPIGVRSESIDPMAWLGYESKAEPSNVGSESKDVGSESIEGFEALRGAYTALDTDGVSAFFEALDADGVKQVQIWLNEEKGKALEVDGVAGSKTLARMRVILKRRTLIL